MSEVLKNLLEDRARAWEQAKPVLDKAEVEKRDLTAEENTEYERISSDIDDLDQRIEQATSRLEREKAADEARSRAEAFIRPTVEWRQDDDSPEAEAEAYFRSWADGNGDRNGFETSLVGLVSERGDNGVWHVRDLTSVTASSGGATVPQSFRRQLYEHLIENSGIRKTRAEVITTASGEELILPKTLTHPGAGTIIAEGAAIQESDPTFGRGTLNAYKYPRLVQVPSELLSDTGVDLLGYLARAFGRAIANGAGVHYITGTGTSQPRGVITAGSIMVTGGTGVSGAPTADNLIDLEYTVKEPYAVNGEWLMRRATVGTVRKLKDSDGQYLWQPSLVVGAPNMFDGYPIHTDPNVPATATGATSVAFGDFSAYKIRDVGQVRFERSDEFAFDTDMVTFRAILRTDGDLLDETGAIGTFKGGTA